MSDKLIMPISIAFNTDESISIKGKILKDKVKPEFRAIGKALHGETCEIILHVEDQQSITEPQTSADLFTEGITHIAKGRDLIEKAETLAHKESENQKPLFDRIDSEFCKNHREAENSKCGGTWIPQGDGTGLGQRLHDVCVECHVYKPKHDGDGDE
jgi:hypothetical protein